MVGLPGLTSQSLGSSSSFNWTWFIELVTCGIIVLWFLFYFNRLFATLISYGIRAYVWHKFRVYVDIHALQLSLLGGRLFFKGIRYHGENETIFIHNGYITWRYWATLARQIDLTRRDNSTTQTHAQPPKDPNDTSDPDITLPHDEEHGTVKVPKRAEARILVSVTGLEWFIYNRTPVYDSIMRDGIKIEEDGVFDEKSSDTETTSYSNVNNRNQSSAVLRKHTAANPSNSSGEASLQKIPTTLCSTSTKEEKQSQDCEHTSTRTSSQGEEKEVAVVDAFYPLILRFFPIGIECSRGAISLGNEHTKAIVVTTFTKAKGHIDASTSGPADIYRQLFDFDIDHPVVQMRPNPDYQMPQMAAAEKIITGKEAVLKRRPWWSIQLNLNQRRRNAAQSLRNLIPMLRSSVESFHGRSHSVDTDRPYTPFTEAHLDATEWHGLDRYLDETDADDHFAWLNVDYARVSTLLDCPSVHLNFYWDTPGTVREEDLLQNVTGLAKDINGAPPPAYGLDLIVRGGTVNYGPWTDRLRGELQGVFLPSSYRSVSATKRLKLGESRQFSVMTIRVEIEDEVTLRVPTRESSKDWRWRGRATAVRDAAALKKQQEKKHFRFRRSPKHRLGPDVRPFGWMDVSVGRDTTVCYVMDMVAGFDGYRNNLELDLKTTKVTSSVNHTNLWSCSQQQVSCDLSNPLVWNDLHTWRFDLLNHDMDLFLLRDHTFLLLDLINDFTAGQKSEYLTFLPFRYEIDIKFSNLKLFLNANDFNIIDSPCDLEDNAFLVLGFEHLAGNVGVSMQYFSPAQSSVTFQGVGKNASLNLKTPLWNTFRTFAGHEIMATLKTLELDGVYNYHSGTSPTLTDSLFMNIIGGGPVFHLEGFLIRYFMNVKENYFGEDIHFRTLEEYQGTIDPNQNQEAAAIKQPVAKSNDLDVILTVRADQAIALMPANIYKRDESLRIDIMLIEADMRFTNYYMDLQVQSSPIEASTDVTTVQGGISTSETTSTQLFIDGFTAFGHRMFGAPPLEPTYVCNWDFDVGAVLGECSCDFLRVMIASTQAFIFTLDDFENALPKSEAPLNDVTFLRVKLGHTRVWCLASEVAFLLELSRADVSLSDWANAHFSKNVKVDVPKITIAAVDLQSAYRSRDSAGHKVSTLACFRTALKLALLDKSADFVENRALQQEHISIHDARTHRTAWLLHEQLKRHHQVTQTSWSREPPAMQAPNMPDPVTAVEDLSEAAPALNDTWSRSRTVLRNRSFVSNEAFYSPVKAPYGKAAVQNTDANHEHAPETYYSHYPGSVSRDRQQSLEATVLPSSVAFSSPWAAPNFLLNNIEPDTSNVPKFHPEVNDPSKHNDNDNYNETSGVFSDQSEDIHHGGVFCTFPEGFLGFCSPGFFEGISQLIKGIDPKSPESIMDALQISTTARVFNLTMVHKGQINDFAIKLPFAKLKLVNETLQATHGNYSIVDHYDVEVLQAHSTLRIAPRVIRGAKHTLQRPNFLTYVAIKSVTIGIVEHFINNSQRIAHAQASVSDLGLWLALQDTIRVRAQVTSVELATSGTNIDNLASLISRSSIMVTHIIDQFDDIDPTAVTRHLIYHLTAPGNSLQDPIFLTRPSYVLRTATEHVRISDSWKMLSRLRNAIPAFSGQHNEPCEGVCPLQENLADAHNHVKSAIDSFKTWERTQEANGPILQALFGDSTQPGSPNSNHVDLEVEVLLGQIALTLDPGPQQSDVTIRGVSFNYSDKSVGLTEGHRTQNRALSQSQKIIQSYCENIAVVLNWEILELINSVAERLGPSFSHAPATSAKEMKVHHAVELRNNLSVIVGADDIAIRVDTVNLQLLTGAERFKASLLLLQPGDSLDNVCLVLNSTTTRLSLESQSRTLLAWKLTSPTICATYRQEVTDLTKPAMVRFAATCAKLRFNMREDILGLMEVANKVIEIEVRQILDTMSLIRGSPTSDTHRSQPDIDIANFHVAFLLNNYKMRFALMPFCHYTIAGNIARTSVVPRTKSCFTINVDLKEQQHNLEQPGQGTAKRISVLRLPPINVRAGVRMAKESISVNVQTTLEQIRLEASDLRACLDTVYRPEAVQYVKDVGLRGKQVQTMIQDLNPSVNTEKESTKQPSTKILLMYSGHLVLAGIKIHCSAPAIKSSEQYSADLALLLGHTSLKLHNRSPSPDVVYSQPQFELHLREAVLSVDKKGSHVQNFGKFSMGLKVQGTTDVDKHGHEVQNYRANTSGIKVDLYAETATLAMDIVSSLRERISSMPMAGDSRLTRPLRRLTIVSREPVIPASQDSESIISGESSSSQLLDSTFSLDMSAIQVRWILSSLTPVAPDRQLEDLVFSIQQVDLKTQREGSARLAIQGLQLQLVPQSRKDPSERSANSALLPEMIFNAAYLTTKRDRRLALKAAGKAVDVRLAADFIVPASALQKSLACASAELRNSKAYLATTESSSTETPSTNLFGNKRLASLLVFADFAGAVVTISPRKEEERTSVFGILKGAKRSRAGRYGQAVQNTTVEEAVLRAPGIALKIEYRDSGHEEPYLSTELKVAASSNTLAPSVVPLILEISSSIKEIIEDEIPAVKRDRDDNKSQAQKYLSDATVDAADPTAILGRVRLNVGLWVQRQEFSLTCQPIARVSATAKFDDIFVTINTVQATEQDRFFSIMTRFTNLSASVQHVYSRESTASFEVESIVMSLMNSKHFSDKSGISAILNISPMKAEVNAKQLQDFLLFREIWYPAELRHMPKAAAQSNPDSDSHAYAIQRYQEMTATSALPWHAVVSVQELNVQVDFGQSLGKSRFSVSKLWASSKKKSNSEQNLCIGFEKVGVDSTGRMSGFVALQGFHARTSIRWPMGNSSARVPLVQGSIGFDHLRMKAAFDYQPFAVADISAFEFLLYNVRQEDQNDRLVGILDGGKAQVFCTTATAAQGLAIIQAFERLSQEKQEAYEDSLRELDKYLRRKSTLPLTSAGNNSNDSEQIAKAAGPAISSRRLHTDVVVTLKAIDIGAFPNTFFDAQILKVEAVDVQARFAVGAASQTTHSSLGMSLGQVRVALANTNRPSTKVLGEVSVPDVIERATTAKGGTILKVPRLVASMQTWQLADSNTIEYIFRSVFQGKVDVGWNYSRISFIRTMWESHSRALASRLGKPLPPSAVKITAEPQSSSFGQAGQEKITAVVNMPQSKYEYVALEPPVIDTPQLRDLGEATPSLEWIGLHRERLPHVTHSVVIVSLLEVAREVEGAYTRILGSG